MLIYKKKDYLSYMADVASCKARITAQSDQWENIKLLCEINCPNQSKTLLPTMTDIQNSFDNLQQQLIDTLITKTLGKMEQKLLSKAQVAVDILIRNLYERTADVGFLATDDDVRRFVALPEKDQGARNQIVERLRAYVAKYSVYEEIIILDKKGIVLANLDQNNRILGKQISDPIVLRTLECADSFLEQFAPSPLQAGKKMAHIFASRIYAEDSGEVIGIICLCFRFENEMALIFKKLSTDYDGAVITIIDSEGTVIASNDENHVPTGITLETVEPDQHGIVYYRGLSYMCKTVPTQGYQNYYGLGWRGLIMIPLHLAFKEKSDIKGIDSEAMNALMEQADSFSRSLNEIIDKTQTINKSLKRIVYNGQIISREGGEDGEFSRMKAILSAIGRIGTTTSRLFQKSVTDLFSTVVSTSLVDASFLASLCIDVMDRNLYERANDCRWWALNSTFRTIMAQESIGEKEKAKLTKILAYINSLYTVYSNLFLYDKTGRIVAVSNPEYAGDVGKILSASFIHNTLSNTSPEKYFVSPFEATPLYDGRHTYVYSASVTDTHNSYMTVGGIGIVFDSAYQFRAMLDDALKSKEDTFAVFTDRHGVVIASTCDIVVGDKLGVPEAMFQTANGTAHSEILLYNGRYYTVGCACSSSYREYKSSDGYRSDVLAFVFEQLTEDGSMSSAAAHADILIEQKHIALTAGDTREKLVTFSVNNQLFALRQEAVLEATDTAGIIPLPDTGELVRGAISYNSQYIAVVDSHSLFRCSQASQSGNHLLILALCEDVFIGLEVDELCSVLEVGTSDLKPVPDFGGGSSISGIICLRGVQNHNILLLNHNALLTKLQQSQSGYDWDEILSLLEKINAEQEKQADA